MIPPAQQLQVTIRVNDGDTTRKIAWLTWKQSGDRPCRESIRGWIRDTVDKELTEEIMRYCSDESFGSFNPRTVSVEI